MERDPRLDVFRGLALATIYIDHVNGNPYAQLTYKNFGFSSAAEGFFLMSGVAAGLAYSVRFVGAGGAGGIASILPMWRRARVLFVTQLLLTACVVAVFGFFAYALSAPVLLDMYNIGPFFDEPIVTIVAALFLSHHVNYVDILPAYCVLLMVAPLSIWIGLRYPVGLLVGSFGLWFVAGELRINIPTSGQGEWMFNPLSWQLLFNFGIICGLAMRRGERLVPCSRLGIVLAGAFLMFALIWSKWPGLGPFLGERMEELSEKGAPFLLTSFDKTYLTLPRVLHVMALLYLLTCIPFVRKVCVSKWAEPFRVMGRQGLSVFAAGTVLSLSVKAFLVGSGQEEWMRWLLPPLGLPVLWAIACFFEVREPGWIGGIAAPARRLLRRNRTPS